VDEKAQFSKAIKKAEVVCLQGNAAIIQKSGKKVGTASAERLERTHLIKCVAWQREVSLSLRTAALSVLSVKV
jgi:hypothetical protein